MNRFEFLLGIGAGLVTSITASTRAELPFEGAVIDAATGAPLAARVYLEDDRGNRHFVESADPEGSAVRYDRRNWINPAAVEIHTTVSAHPFRALLPPGGYTLVVERGKEYFPSTNRFVLEARPLALRIPLRRWVNLADRGWYSGETHLHRTVDELRNVMLAEDLNVAFPLSGWVTRAGQAPAAGDRNLPGEHPAEWIVLDDTHALWPRNTEYEIFTVGERAHTLGALFLLHHRQVFTIGVPPWKPVADLARAEGALLDMDKLDWPFSFMLPPVTGATLYEVANNHLWRTVFAFTNYVSPAPPYLQPPYGGRSGTERDWTLYTHGMFHTLLNAGHPVVPTAGTASGVHPVPAGFSRVYVHLPDGFCPEAWVRGLAAGRSFVTTGPMLFATVNDEAPGTRFGSSAPPFQARVTGTVLSEGPLSFLEILHNGVPARTVMPVNRPTPEGAIGNRFDESFSIESGSWLAVRVWEDRPDGRFRWAHSAPWHIEIPDRPLRVRAEEKAFLVDRLEQEIRRSRHLLAPEALDEYAFALEAYQRLVPGDDGDFAGQARPPRDDAGLRFWLENMVVHHRFTPEEVRAATGLDPAVLEAALDRFTIRPGPAPVPPPGAPLRVLPYPGGRHPRLGFLEGALAPQRDTKLSVFTPWDPSSYVVVDVPEAIFSNLGLIYLAHTHIPTVWDERGQTLPPLEWTHADPGVWSFERPLPNGIVFGARAVSRPEAVHLELWLRNGTDQPLTQMRVQNCVMLKAAAGFHAQTSRNKRFHPPYIAASNDDGTRWIITAWEPLHRLWANPPVPCMHADPHFPDCPPGDTVRLRGALWFFEGTDLEVELRRLDASPWREEALVDL